MGKVPSLPYTQILHALQRNDWVVVRQRGSHIGPQKHTPAETLKVTVPTHRPIKRSTFSHILKQARLSVDDLLALLSGCRASWLGMSVRQWVDGPPRKDELTS